MIALIIEIVVIVLWSAFCLALGFFLGMVCALEKSADGPRMPLPDPRPPGDFGPFGKSWEPRPMTPRGEPTGVPEVANGGRYL